MFYSQAGQDVWVLQKIAKGFFVDVGAYDGIESSNTYALELVGWEGICIEPNVESFNQLARNRKCMMTNFYAGDENRGEFITLAEVLDGRNAPKKIDYISIDTDGNELDVLKGMDFEKYHVRMITIEHNQYLEGKERQQQIFDYLTSRGFVRTVKDVKCLDPNYFGLIYEDWYENRFIK